MRKLLLEFKKDKVVWGNRITRYVEGGILMCKQPFVVSEALSHPPLNHTVRSTFLGSFHRKGNRVSEGRRYFCRVRQLEISRAEI